MLDDGVVGRPAVDERDGVQRDADADEVEDFVDEGPEQREGEIAIVNPVPFFFFFFFFKYLSRTSFPSQPGRISVHQQEEIDR